MEGETDEKRIIVAVGIQNGPKDCVGVGECGYSFVKKRVIADKLLDSLCYEG